MFRWRLKRLMFWGRINFWMDPRPLEVPEANRVAWASWDLWVPLRDTRSLGSLVAATGAQWGPRGPDPRDPSPRIPWLSPGPRGAGSCSLMSVSTGTGAWATP